MSSLASPPETDSAAPGPAGSQADPPSLASDVRPVSMPLVDRVASAVVTAVPPIMVVIGMWLGWVGNLLQWQDLLILALSYMIIGSGITVGFHRLLTHRSFKCHRVVRAGFAALGSAAAEGPVIDWVATHRKHHVYSDVEGDPHSPHVDPAPGGVGAVAAGSRARRLGVPGHGGGRREPLRARPDGRPRSRFVHRTFLLWVLVGLALPWSRSGAHRHGPGRADGPAVGRCRADLPLHHATFSINSLCHFFGRRTSAPATNRATSRGSRSRPGGGMAQQPSRLPDVVPTRSRALADRSFGRDHPRAGDDGRGLRRRAGGPQAARAQGGARRRGSLT